MKAERGCEEDSPIPDAWDFDGYKVQRCPLKVLDPDIYKVIQAYNYFKRGMLPNVGGWRDQSSKFVEFMEIMEREIDKIRKSKNGRK